MQKRKIRLRATAIGLLYVCSIAQAEVTDLRCESVVTPTGITTTKPHFSWTFVPDEQHPAQGGYRIQLTKDRQWSLVSDKEILAEGSLSEFDGAAWHQLELHFRDKRIEAFIDEQPVAVVNHTRRRGHVSLASSYDANLFDNLEVLP